MVTLEESHADETVHVVFAQNFIKQGSQSALLGVRAATGKAPVCPGESYWYKKTEGG